MPFSPRGSVVRSLVIAYGLFAVASIVFGDPPAVPKLSTVFDAEPLVEQVAIYVEDLNKALADPATFEANKAKVKQSANSLIVLALVLSHHDNAPSVGTAPLIAPAHLIAKASDHGAAVAGLQSLNRAYKQTAATTMPTPPWAKTASMGKVMTEVEQLNTRLRGNMRRFAQRADDNRRIATVMAAVGQYITYDTHEVKNADDLPAWYEMSAEMRDASAELAEKIKQRDEPGAKAALERVSKNCEDCHEKFR